MPASAHMVRCWRRAPSCLLHHNMGMCCSLVHSMGHGSTHPLLARAPFPCCLFDADQEMRYKSLGCVLHKATGIGNESKACAPHLATMCGSRAAMYYHCNAGRAEQHLPNTH
jgi:hypothetical protein